MEYSIHELSKLTGLTTRTLRYYDEIDLLRPLRVNDAGYRFYGPQQVEALQQILFYRERGFALGKIAQLLRQTEFDRLAALQEHLDELKKQQDHVAELIHAVTAAIASMKGEIVMGDKQRFEAFKRRIVQENEAAYGQEARERHGARETQESNQKMLEMTPEEYNRFEELNLAVKQRLKQAVEAKEEAQSESGREIACLHREWLEMTWAHYTAQAHRGLAALYLADERFQRYYDEQTPGCAQFLADAITHWIGA